MAVEDYSWSVVVAEANSKCLVRKPSRIGKMRIRKQWREARKRYYQRHPDRARRATNSYKERHKERLKKHYKQKQRKKVLTGEAREDAKKKQQKKYQKLIDGGYIRVVNGRRYYWWKYAMQLISLSKSTFLFYQRRGIIPKSLYLIKQRRCFSEKQLQMMRIAFKKNRRKLGGKRGVNEWSKQDLAEYLFNNWRAHEDPEILPSNNEKGG